MKPIKYSEIFFSPQGEGKFVGVPTVWLRFFTCNLSCDGFGQKDPTKPETYILPYKEIDAKAYTKLEDLPVFSHGCDSSYSWSAKFKHLQHTGTVQEVSDRIRAALPQGKFNCGANVFDMCFTGGEPMLPAAQAAAMALMEHWREERDMPTLTTFETNGTQLIKDDAFFDSFNCGNTFMSISPKLFTVSGEKDAVKPDVIDQYSSLTNHGQLKFVVNGTKECWDELEDAIARIYATNCQYPVYLMPVGATKDSQESLSTADVIREAGRRGYTVTPRAHAHWFGNTIGV